MSYMFGVSTNDIYTRDLHIKEKAQNSIFVQVKRIGNKYIYLENINVNRRGYGYTQNSEYRLTKSKFKEQFIDSKQYTKLRSNKIFGKLYQKMTEE